MRKFRKLLYDKLLYVNSLYDILKNFKNIFKHLKLIFIKNN
jgi:hypothetical protein